MLGVEYPPLPDPPHANRGLTHFLTQNAAGAGSIKRHGAGRACPVQLFSCGLRRFADDRADGVGGVALHLLRRVGVGAQREPHAEVSEGGGERRHVHAVLER